jgi:hypothetical protein
MSDITTIKPASVLAENKPHGTRIKYMGGCRCLPCRAANSRYSVECEARKKRGEGNPIVSASRAREHILQLSKQGIGRRAISDACDIGQSSIGEIKRGIKKQIRRETERKILSVDSGAAAGGTLVCVKSTWRRINWLLKEGFTKKELAQRLGYARQLQIRRDKCCASTAAKVEKFYNRIRAGDEEEIYQDNIENFIENI